MKYRIHTLMLFISLLFGCSSEKPVSVEKIKKEFPEQISYLNKIAYEYKEFLNNYKREDLRTPQGLFDDEAILQIEMVVMTPDLLENPLKYDGYRAMKLKTINVKSSSHDYQGQKSHPRTGIGKITDINGAKYRLSLYQDAVIEKGSGFKIFYTITFDRDKL